MSLFSMLFHNCVKIENLPTELPKRYLLRQLLRRGAIAYDKITSMYLPFVAMELNQYALPVRYTLYGYRGMNVQREAKDVVILRANDIQYSLLEYFNQQANLIAKYDVAIEQNLEAIKVASLIKVNSKETLLSLANADYARQIGASIVFTDKTLNLDSTLTCAQTGAQYLVDKLQEARRIVLNETLSVIGISTANTDKRERVQTMEVLSSLGFAKDCLNTLVDTFNYDAEMGGLEMRFKPNTAINDTNIQNEGGNNEE